jgi:hypothetical protein
LITTLCVAQENLEAQARHEAALAAAAAIAGGYSLGNDDDDGTPTAGQGQEAVSDESLRQERIWRRQQEVRRLAMRTMAWIAFVTVDARGQGGATAQWCIMSE